MPNKQYVKGRRKEYGLVHREKKLGRTAFRSAGSHSPIDVVSIDAERKEIWLIQSKPDSMSITQRLKILNENHALNGIFIVHFEVA